MSERSRRGDPEVYSIDYRRLHRTGERVNKPRVNIRPDMDLQNKQLREKQLRDDLTEFFLLFSLANLETSDKIQEAYTAMYLDYND